MSDIPATPTPEELKRLADQLDMVLPDSHMSTSHHDLERLRRASKTLRALAAARATDQQRIEQLEARIAELVDHHPNCDKAFASCTCEREAERDKFDRSHQEY